MATVMTTTFELAGADGAPLRGDVRTADRGENRPAVIICHGFKGFKDWGFFPRLADRLAHAGFTAVSFNFSGSGIGPNGESFSEPERFAHATFSNDLDDIAVVYDALADGMLAGEVASPSKIGLFGHSRGGGMSMVFCSERDVVGALVTWAAIGTVRRWPPDVCETFAYWSAMVADIDVIGFGIHAQTDVRASDIVADGGGSNFQLHLYDASIDVRLALPGQHNIRNACAAAAIAVALGVAPEQIRSGLESVKPVAGRLQPKRGLFGATLFDDSYNANPLSVIAAAEFLAELEGQSWLVLGDMGELGADTARLHQEVGAAVKKAGVNQLFATGELSRNVTDAFGDHASWFDCVDTLIDALRASITSDVNVLVKGSRFMRMERVVAALTSTDASGGED